MPRIVALIVILVLPLFALSQDPEQNPTNEVDDANAPASTDATNTAETAPAVVVERHTPNPDRWRRDDVQRFLDNFNRNQEIRDFGAEALVTSGLYLPENTGKPQGGVLILHDLDQHAHWPQTIAPLREYLPDYGWNTLSLFMTGAVTEPLPKRDIPTESNTPADPTTEGASPSSPADAAASDEALVDEDVVDEIQPEPAGANAEADAETNMPTDELDAIADSLDEIPDLASKSAQQAETPEPEEDKAAAYIKLNTDRVSSGITQLNQLGQFNLVIIAHGASANWAAAALNEIYEKMPDAKGFALVMVDAHSSLYPPYPLNNMLANLDIPMLDLVTVQEETALRQAYDRRNGMQRKQREGYQQIRIPQLRTNLRGKHNALTRRVRGWLQTNAAGEEVQVKTKKS